VSAEKTRQEESHASMTCMSIVEGTETGKRTVPERLIGCWRRNSIAFPDGTEDRTTRVIWLQTASGVADMRIAAERPDLRHRDGLASCTKEELLALAEQDCFCAATLFDPTTTPYPTAIWPLSLDLFRYQPVVSYPEPGWLEWRSNGSVMIEYAPSGAYEEDWRLVESTPGFAVHLMRSQDTATECLYVVGDHAIRARGRRRPISEQRPLVDVVHGMGNNLAQICDLLDCEFSYAQRAPGDEQFRIVLSTLPWLEGHALDCEWTFAVAPRQTLATGPDGQSWKVDTLWRRKGIAH
jgi:hypothetical protein